MARCAPQRKRVRSGPGILTSSHTQVRKRLRALVLLRMGYACYGSWAHAPTSALAFVACAVHTSCTGAKGGCACVRG
eukprot:9410739-Alexandrium_andersonii.AAC.1